MENTCEELQQQLALKQRAIDLILAIDYVRDTTPEPSNMMTSLVSVLAEHLRVDLCLICLADRGTRELRLKAVCDKDSRFGRLSQKVLHESDVQTLDQQHVQIWEDEQVPADLKAQSPSGTLYVAVIPIFMKDERLGVMLFARLTNTFMPDDVELIKVAESQVDSAVIQAYEYYTLQLRTRELETIYRVDSIRDQHMSFDEMLNAVLGEVRQVIHAEAGFIMLYNQSEKFLELRATTNDDLFPITPHYDFINTVANESLDKARMMWHNELESELHSIMCLPLILNGEIIGVLGVVNRYGRHNFDSDDRRLLGAIASQMDTAIFESIEQRRLRQILGRSVDPRVMERLLASPEQDILNRERTVISVLYADIRGSTALAEKTEPDLLVGFINDYLGRMADVILAHEGTLDKFVGDEVMALFGAPLPQPDHALRSIKAGLDMQKAHQDVMAAWAPQGVAEAPIGVGIATGELIVGEFGCQKRTDYTVIGRAANLGSRICSVAKGGEVMVSRETYDLVQDQVEAVPVTGLQMKGVAHDVTVYHILRVL